MIEKLEWLQKGEGIAFISVTVIALGTILLAFHRIADATWLDLTKWALGIWIGGAAASAYRT